MYIMFSSYERLQKRSGKKGVDRFQYLKELIEEFSTTESSDAKEQVLANLANFSYDPINYQWLRRLKVIDIFLHQLSEGTLPLRRFAAAGICNLCLDFENKSYILQNGGVQLLTECLVSEDESLVLSSITSLMFLVTPQSKSEITSDKVVKLISVKAEGNNPRITNLAKIFLSDYHYPVKEGDPTKTEI
ncbi:armadillo repeat-containing protein 7 [Macrobrachium rosenbergii]|uniref:armadillo repeat-containing protein 7 n=1 Tax=Macrobrachium rosenbergii TaxID=79674 RepID=UPI0034D65196